MMRKPEELLNIINQRITKLQFGKNPENLYDPVSYIMNLGGKRLRPLLTLLSYNLFSDSDIEKAFNPALAVEIFHNFTLMHDDVMDKAPIRRGKPTVHEKWNINTAMLSGDVMLVRVYDQFLSVDHDLLPGIIKKFNDCAARVCEGQQLDMDFETIENVSESQYLEMIKLKTAVLLGFSLELGALIGNSTIGQASLMNEVGINIGLGFQLKDDLLDVYADNSDFGKQLGGDIISNKKTYLLIKATELATGSLNSELHKWIKNSNPNNEDKIRAVTSIYDQLGIKKITAGKIEEYFHKGFKALESIDTDDARKKEIRDYLEKLIHREI